MCGSFARHVDPWQLFLLQLFQLIFLLCTGNGSCTKEGSNGSAYSAAPHKITCPYCPRKFPWTSSLKRHILTHTGQKPYKVYCNLLLYFLEFAVTEYIFYFFSVQSAACGSAPSPIATVTCCASMEWLLPLTLSSLQLTSNSPTL